MQPSPSRATSTAPSELERLSDFHAALADAGSERALVEALAGYLARWDPDAVNLIYFHLDPKGDPLTGAVVAASVDGQIFEGLDVESTRFLLADYGTTAVWTGAPHEPLLVGEIATDPRVDATLRSGSEARGHNALALLPLYSETYGGWQGMVNICWKAARAFTAEDRTIFRLLISSLATHVGGRRSREALRAALAEADLLQQVTARLSTASDLNEIMAALAMPAPTQDGLFATIGTFEEDNGGAPKWLTIMHRWDPGKPPNAELKRGPFSMREYPFASTILADPTVPAILCDAETDPRVDTATREGYRRAGYRAMVNLVLTLRGRWIGLFSLVWSRPVELGARERRIYSALSTQAALLIENHLVLDRLHASLAKTEQKSATLGTLMDHLPVGVVMTSSAGGVVLMNPAAKRMLNLRSDSSDLKGAGESIVYPDTDQRIPRSELPATRAIATGLAQTHELDVVGPDAARRHIEAIAAPVRDEAGAIKNVVLLLSDITARKVSERERARLQEEVIRVQEATLAELSSPLIPITDDIVVLPLIGSLSTARGQQVIDALLSGTSRNRAKVAILDITGLRSVDTQAASMITSAARALRLLGVEPILTGIQPEVAQTLVTLGASLDGIATRGTLQSGVQYALRHLGRSTFR